MKQQLWYDGWPVFKTFPGHKGRPGEVGGSLARSQGGGLLRRDKMAALPKGTKIRWNAGLRSEARAEPDNVVFLGPKFWGSHMDDEARADVLAHEFGHILEQESKALTGKGFDEALVALKIPMPDWAKGHYEWWGYGGDSKVTEALSWAYSDYVAGRLKEGPACDFVDSLVSEYPEFGRIDFPAIVAKLKPGPEGGILTIFDKVQKSSAKETKVE